MQTCIGIRVNETAAPHTHERSSFSNKKQTQENKSFLVCIHTYNAHACMHAHITHTSNTQCTRDQHVLVFLKHKKKNITHTCMRATYKSEKRDD